ncbi:non-canonical purine NTP pyrophosphatase, partial [Escherichia coli]
MTLIDNAILNARPAAPVPGLPALADDSGLAGVVRGGAPGSDAARSSGEDATDRRSLQKLLDPRQVVPD